MTFNQQQMIKNMEIKCISPEWDVKKQQLFFLPMWHQERWRNTRALVQDRNQSLQFVTLDRTHMKTSFSKSQLHFCLCSNWSLTVADIFSAYCVIFIHVFWFQSFSQKNLKCTYTSLLLTMDWIVIRFKELLQQDKFGLFEVRLNWSRNAFFFTAEQDKSASSKTDRL